MGTIEYLDALRVRLGIQSDYALAKRLGITRSAISQYRHGRSGLSDDVALQVADLLGRDRAAVYLSIQAERAAKTGNAAIVSVLTDALRRIAA